MNPAQRLMAAVASGGTSYLVGGVVSTDGIYLIHTFLSSGSFDFININGPLTVEYLVIGAGGGGGTTLTTSRSAGGGGAGGYRAGSVSINSNQPITVGAGAVNANGGNSSIGSLVVAAGGGLGGNGSGAQPGAAGGSGGGGQHGSVGGAGTAGQGYAGGNGYDSGNVTLQFGGGGGGGASAVGGAGQSSGSGTAGSGGAGIASSITGSSVTRGGGGGGGAQAGSGATVATYGSGSGGTGGGGTGALYRNNVLTTLPAIGTPNTGGGGGGGASRTDSSSSINGGAGGSGIVVVRYPVTALTPITSPLQVAGLQLWLDASDAASFAYSSGNVVSQWNDKSGNGKHLTQGTVFNQPTRNTTINGLSAVNFNGTAHNMLRTLTPINDATNGAWTIFCVVRPEVVTGVQCIVDGDNGSTRIGQYLRLNAAVVETIGFRSGTPGTDTAGMSASANVAYLLTSVNTGTSVEAFNDGVGGGATALGGTQTYSSSTSFGIGGSLAGSQKFDGDIAEVLCYNSALSTSTRRAIEEYLRAKWATTGVITAPTQIAGCVGWYDASDPASFVYSSGVVVSQWNDKSGVGNHVTQATVSKQPFRTGTQNGLAVVAFDGTDIMMGTPVSVIGATAMTVFAVFRRTGTDLGSTAQPVTVSFGNAGRPIEGYNANRIINQTGSISGALTMLGPTVDSYGVWCYKAVKDAGGVGVHSGSEWYNGVSTSTPGTATTSWLTTSQQIVLAGRQDEGTKMPGDIAEILIYDAALNNTDRALVEAYLRNKWGTP